MKRGPHTRALGVALAVLYWLPALLFIGLLGNGDYGTVDRQEIAALQAQSKHHQLIAFVVAVVIFGVLFAIWRRATAPDKPMGL
jgi:hypothetical protein